MLTNQILLTNPGTFSRIWYPDMYWKPLITYLNILNTNSIVYYLLVYMSIQLIVYFLTQTTTTVTTHFLEKIVNRKEINLVCIQAIM